MKPRSVAVSDVDWARWQAFAAARGVSVSELVRDAVNPQIAKALLDAERLIAAADGVRSAASG